VGGARERGSVKRERLGLPKNQSGMHHNRRICCSAGSRSMRRLGIAWQRKERQDVEAARVQWAPVAAGAR
jgi:hypothetical protein